MESLLRHGIDWNSVLIYLVNVGVLFFVIGYFVTEPILKMIDKRRHAISSSLSEAEKVKQEFLKLREDASKEREAAHAKLTADLERMEKELTEKRKQMLSQVEEKRSQMMDEARKVIEDEKRRLIESAKADIFAFVQSVMQRIVSTDVSEEVIQKSITREWEQYSGK